MEGFIILNLNASRIRIINRISNILLFLDSYAPFIVCIQEIHIVNALKVFSSKYEVFINIDENSNDGIGIVTLVKKGLHVSDSIIGLNGRIIGLKIQNIQVWNVYPPSGTENKKNREIFFRETLCTYMMNWKDHSRYIIESGDHNCTHRLLDSMNNSAQHLQPGLVKHMQIHGLSDDFLNVHGQDFVMYSRITNRSKTRIDYILSNSKLCSYFQYVNPDLGLDHSAVVARFDIPLSVVRDFVPRDRFFSGWVISKRLETDTEFLKISRGIFDLVKEESDLASADLDPSFFWLKAKSAIINLAKDRERELRTIDENKLDVLKGFYGSILIDIKNGVDCFQELHDVKKQLDLFYKEKSESFVEKMRCLQIDDMVYDIHKLQNQKKYENQRKISELKIGDQIFEGTENVVNGIKGKMSTELKAHGGIPFDTLPSAEELYFLNQLEKMILTEEEKEELLKPTCEEEISHILQFEVDPDSSPGEDGITYRFINTFWGFPAYRFLFLNYLNFTRDSGTFGLVENYGLMVVKNKKCQSNLYEKKRKLTKINKDSNLGNGKVWTNRLKKIIIPKVLPQNQFNCQGDINIIDEVREIRNVNLHLLNNGDGQINGTILSIDFKDAFRSMSLRWFNLVMKFLGFPQPFIDWFWTMYNDLSVVIFLNKYKSEKIKVERGFMEGHPPSMAAFVIGLIPLMIDLEGKLKGIKTSDGKTHRIKCFADDMKGFLSDTAEVEIMYNTVSKFEDVSGLEMHRDPTREKCQALPFGSHKNFQDWPTWVTVKSSIKVVGILFSNSESLEEINSAMVSKSFHDVLHKSYGIRGTIMQKVYFVNTFLFSKLWYVAQCIKIDEKVISKILAKAFNFIYAGENERPVRVLNFRNKSVGGLGLINPSLKAKALLIRSMIKDFKEKDGDLGEWWNSNDLYGHTQGFLEVASNDLLNATVKEIYNFLLAGLIYKNGSLVPSRNEKKEDSTKWSLVWKNLNILKGLSPEEKCFAWKLTQDMLPVGARIHRRNAERRCLAELPAGLCQVDQSLIHAFQMCQAVQETHNTVLRLLSNFLGRCVTSKQLISLFFNHRKKKKLICALWFAVKIMYKIFQDRNFNKSQILSSIIKEINWNLKLCRKIGSHSEMSQLKMLLNEEMVSGQS